MDTRTTEYGSTRYSFPLGRRNPSEVIRIFEKDNRLSFHFIFRESGKLKTESQFVLSARKDKLYYYRTTGRRSIIALPCDRIDDICINITKIIFRQSTPPKLLAKDYTKVVEESHKRMAFTSINSLKKVLYTYLRKNISWYPKINIHKLRINDIMLLGLSKLLADIYVYEGKVCYPNGLVTNALRHSNALTGFSKKVFGFSSPWAIKQSIGILNGDKPFAVLFKRILPVDKIIDAYKTISHYKFPEVYNISLSRNFLKMFHYQTVFNWYTKSCIGRTARGTVYEKTQAELYLVDTLRLWELLPDEYRILPNGENDLRVIHDTLSLTYNKIKHKDYKLKIRSNVLPIDNAIIDDMKIVVPKTKHELVEWGTRMSNCIASYSDKSCILLGVKKNEELVYCIEVTNKRIQQFLGKYNKEAPSVDVIKIASYLNNKKLIELSSCGKLV